MLAEAEMKPPGDPGKQDKAEQEMCVIVHNPEGKPLDKEVMRTTYENNPHGYGFMWVEGGRVHSTRAMPTSFDDVWEAIQKFEGRSYTLHLRWRTTGNLGKEQCHPHTVLTKQQHGIDLALVHNGTFFGVGKHDSKSDTQLFVEQLRHRLITDCSPGRVLGSIQSEVESFNKIVLLSTSHTLFVNEDQGAWIDDVWFSNVYSFEKGYRIRKAFDKHMARRASKPLGQSATGPMAPRPAGKKMTKKRGRDTRPYFWEDPYTDDDVDDVGTDTRTGRVVRRRKGDSANREVSVL